jgi:hypothetical protein
MKLMNIIAEISSQIKENDPRIEFVHLDVAAIPPEGIIEHIKDHFWLSHPNKGIIYLRHNRRFRSPLCSHSYEDLSKMWHEFLPWTEILFIRSVFQRVRIASYVQKET